jgi:hypothetical protein
MTPKLLWELVRQTEVRAGIEKLAPPDLRRYPDLGIVVAPAPVSATAPAANSIRFNSCSGTFRSRLQNDTSGGSKSFGALSMTDLALSQTRSADIENRWAADRPPLGDFRGVIQLRKDQELLRQADSASVYMRPAFGGKQ